VTPGFFSPASRDSRPPRDDPAEDLFGETLDDRVALACATPVLVRATLTALPVLDDRASAPPLAPLRAVPPPRSHSRSLALLVFRNTTRESRIGRPSAVTASHCTRFCPAATKRFAASTALMPDRKKLGLPCVLVLALVYTF